MTASLDHAMWFHRRTGRPGALDGWLLYTQEARRPAAGVGLGDRQLLHGADGTHLATVVQEGMIRKNGGGAQR